MGIESSIQIIRHQNLQHNDQDQYHDQDQYNNTSASQTPGVSDHSTPYSHQYQIDRPDSQYEQLAPPNPETPQSSRPKKPRYRSPPPEPNEYASDRTTSSRGTHDDHERPRRPWGKQDRARDTQRKLERPAGNIARKIKKNREIREREEERETKDYERQTEESCKAPVDRQGRSRRDADDRNHRGEKERSGRVHWE